MESDWAVVVPECEGDSCLRLAHTLADDLELKIIVKIIVVVHSCVIFPLLIGIKSDKLKRRRRLNRPICSRQNVRAS